MDDRLNSLLDLVRTAQAKQREIGLLQTEIMLEVVSVLRELEKPISSLNTYIDDTIDDKISGKNMDNITAYIDDKIERMLLDAQHYVETCLEGLEIPSPTDIEDKFNELFEELTFEVNVVR